MKCSHCKKNIQHGDERRAGLRTVHKTCFDAFLDATCKKVVAQRKQKQIKAKKKLPSWYRKKAIEEAKKIAKLRDNYTCQRCYKTKGQCQLQGSHNISVGRAIWLACDVENILTLCAYCHLRFWHSSPIEAMEWFKGRFPERCEYLLEQVKNQRKVNWEEEYNRLKRY